MNTTYKNIVQIVALVVVIAFAIALFGIQKADAVFPNYQVRINSMATTTVGPQTDTVLFYERAMCGSRVITTYTQPISISFQASSTFNVSPTAGHLQGASTTVAYDAEIYGCGQIVAAAGASTTITISEFSF
jgi:hypothetical protein